MTTPTLVKTGHNRVTATASNSISWTPAAVGNTLIVWFNTGITQATCTVSDTQSNTWSTAVALTVADDAYVAAFYTTAAAATADTITVAYSGSGASIIYVAEYSGVGAFDKASTVTGGTASPMTTSSVTPSESGELAIACIGTNAAAIVSFSAWTNGFTQEDTYTANVPCGAWADQVLSAAGSISTGCTINTSVRWASFMLLFEPAASSSFSLPDSVNPTFVSGSSGQSITASGSVVPNDLLLAYVALYNVSAGNAGYIPVVSDNVNSGNYQSIGTAYTTGGQIVAVLAMVANSSGTPTLALGAAGTYNGSTLGYDHFTGFTGVCTYDVGSFSSTGGASSTIAGNASISGSLEVVVAKAFGTTASWSANPVGWAQEGSVGSAEFATMWQSAAAGTSSFSGTATTTQTWWQLFMFGFSNGSLSPINSMPIIMNRRNQLYFV